MGQRNGETYDELDPLQSKAQLHSANRAIGLPCGRQSATTNPFRRHSRTVSYNKINVKKLQFIHTVNGDGSKTAKIIKRQC